MSSPEPLRHLIIPGALLPLPADQPRPAIPPLPHLDALLRQLPITDRVQCDDECPSDPAELATARALNLPSEPGRIPWAALETGTLGTPCAWLVPCHWQLGMDHVLLTDPVQYQEMARAVNPYGDGHAGARSAAAIAQLLGIGQRMSDFKSQ